MATSRAKTTSTATKTTRSTRSSSRSKTTVAKKPPVSAAPKAATPLPKVVTLAEPVLTAPEMRKKELIEMVVERSGVKKRDAKPTVEALLAILGEALANGRELNLPPMGKLKVRRNEQKSGGRVLTCRVRQNEKPAEPAKEPLAEATE
ncbi:HU family DNA-binding protein [Primorskyibacter sp. S87]|uniref:HU family DNA-binding protein n=1 Tax=Primorskyibacter sp. S87 TaxID=3415126 RepID=UPI003C7CA1EE